MFAYLAMAILNLFLVIYIAAISNSDLTAKAVLSFLCVGMFLMWSVEFVRAQKESRRQLTRDQRMNEYQKVLEDATAPRRGRRGI